MNLDAVELRPTARRDVEEAAAWYGEQGGATLEAHFLEGVHAALTHIAVHPASGSPRYAALVGYPDLRFWMVKGFPYLVFYLDRGEWLDVWRVLHAERDIADWLREG